LRKYGDKFAIIASAVLFACMHGNMVQIPYTVVGGMLLGYLAVATGSLWPSVILHFVNNLYSVVIIAVNDNFGENASTVVTVLMLIAFVVIGVMGIVRFIKLKYKVTLTEEKTLTIGAKISAFTKNGPTIVAIVLLIAITISNIKF
jgi:membrane protease YdiL (CAAX protease family)